MRSLMNTDYILRLERGQNEQKSILWMNVVLVASLLAGMVFPMADGNVQAKQKKVLVAFFLRPERQKVQRQRLRASAKGAKVQSGANLTDSSAAGVAKWVKKKVK